MPKISRSVIVKEAKLRTRLLLQHSVPVRAKAGRGHRRVRPLEPEGARRIDGEKTL